MELNAWHIELGDIGIIAGRKGPFCVYAGAALPKNIVACSESARKSAEPADVLRMTDGTMCFRHEFTPLHYATHDQLLEALIGWT